MQVLLPQSLFGSCPCFKTHPYIYIYIASWGERIDTFREEECCSQRLGWRQSQSGHEEEKTLSKGFTKPTRFKILLLIQERMLWLRFWKIQVLGRWSARIVCITHLFSWLLLQFRQFRKIQIYGRYIYSSHQKRKSISNYC